MATQPRLVNKQFNTPIGLYSEQNVREVLHREQQILSNGAIGIDFNNPGVGKPGNLQNSAVLRMLEEEENRRGGRAGVKRVAWPPPQEGVLDPAEVVEHNAVHAQGGPQSYNQSPGLQQNSFTPQRAAPQQQSAQPSYRPLKPLDVSSVGAGSPLASPALNQSPQGYRTATPTKGWAPVQSPVTTPTSQKYFGAPAQGYQSQPQYQPAAQAFQQPNQSYQEPGRQYGQPAQRAAPQPGQQFGQPAQQHQPSGNRSQTAPYSWQEPGRQYGQPAQQRQPSAQQYQQPNQYQQPPQQYQQPPQQYQQPSQQYQQPPQQYQQPSQQYQQPPQQYQQPSQQYQQPPQQYQQPSQQYQQPPQQYQQPSQQYQQPPQQYQQPPQNYQQPPQQYQAPSQQFQSPQSQYQSAPQQYQSQSFAQPATPLNQAPSQPVAAKAQAAPRPQPAKQVEPPPSTITLRPAAPVSQAPAPVFNTQPATATLKGGKHLRGDLKWPPENVRQRMADDQAHLEELAKGPANRPSKREKDYSRFFAEHALNSTYPGYKIPPGTQFYRAE